MATLTQKHGTATTAGDANARHRLQFEFSAEAYERLNTMKDKTRASSYADLVRNALRMYEWLVEQQENGCEIALVKEGQPLKAVQFMF